MITAGSRESDPTITFKARAKSATWAAMGPTVSNDNASGMIPPRPVSPKVGRRPAIPLADAGPRIDPPVSVPNAKAANPAAIAAPFPPLEPAGERSSA